MKYSSFRGFIHTPTLLIVLGGVVVLGTVGYFAYKVGQSSGISVTPASLATTTSQAGTTTTAMIEDKKPIAPAVKTETKAVVVQTTVTPSDSAPAASGTDGSTGGGSGSYTPPDLTIDVSHVGQNIYKYDSGTKYGAYGITFDVHANGGDVLIPMTTTDTTKGTTGVSYSITGDYFGSGSERSSKFECSIQTTESGTRYCKVKDGGTTTISVTVWLTPYYSGSYGVSFDTLKAWVDGEYKNYNLNEETERLYIGD